MLLIIVIVEECTTKISNYVVPSLISTFKVCIIYFFKLLNYARTLHYPSHMQMTILQSVLYHLWSYVTNLCFPLL